MALGHIAPKTAPNSSKYINITNRGCCGVILEKYSIEDNRRKFRSQTSDNIGEMKSRDGKSQRREEKRKEEKKKENQQRESLRRKKIQVREKVGKSRNSLFFQ
jgi:hypothetical protein